MTVLELMIVIAIIGGLVYIAASGFRLVTKGDLVDDATRIASLMRRSSQLAMTYGKLYRVTLDFEKKTYGVEQCEGPAQVRRVTRDSARRDEPFSERARNDAIEAAQERLRMAPPGGGPAMVSATPEADMARATALAGQQVGASTCTPAEDPSADASGKDLTGSLRADKGIKVREVWVQHLEDSLTDGNVQFYFFPNGSAEKAILELTDGSATFSVLVYGLTGKVELRDGEVEHPEDHMMRDAEGDKEAER
jgi:type II secretory pathway pseudopilin PulG